MAGICFEKAFLGIEFGSTRIKAVLIGGDFAPLAALHEEIDLVPPWGMRWPWFTATIVPAI